MLLRDDTPRIAMLLHPASWDREMLITMLMDLQEHDATQFHCYLGVNTTADALSRAMLEFSYKGIEPSGRKYKGGYGFRIALDHAVLKESYTYRQYGEDAPVCEHLVIFSITPTEDGISMRANVFDGVERD